MKTMKLDPSTYKVVGKKEQAVVKEKAIVKKAEQPAIRKVAKKKVVEKAQRREPKTVMGKGNKSLREVVTCPQCGNGIKNYNPKNHLKCFGCNSYLYRSSAGWILDGRAEKKDEMTVEAVLKESGIAIKRR